MSKFNATDRKGACEDLQRASTDERKRLLEAEFELSQEELTAEVQGQVSMDETPDLYETTTATFCQQTAEENIMDVDVDENLQDSHIQAFPDQDATHEFSQLAEEYRVHCSEELSQKPEENQPQWLIEHLEGIKESLESELGDINSTFELDAEDTLDWSEHESEAQEMDEIRNMETKEEQLDNGESKPIYPGSRITVGISVLLIMTVVIRHSLTGQALNDILKLIWLHCMGSNESLRSINMLKRYFCNLASPLKFHWYCSYCYMLLKDKNEHVCPNTFCNRNLSIKGNLSFFVEVPIVEQIKQMFAKAGFYDQIQHRFDRARNHNSVCDIYDGRLYKELSSGTFPLSSPHNISFTWNTDGVPVFKSSSFSLWPLYLVVNELPPRKRFSKENMILAGLWFGPSKPAMWSYLKPFHSALSDLERNGVTVECPNRDTFNVCAILLCGTCDLPAKACVCNTVQYNGKFGCSKCLQPGCTVKTGSKGGHVHAFPFDASNVKGPVRTHEESIEDAKEAIAQGKPIRGTKGPCWFAGLKYYDMIRGTAVDYMHCVLQGVTKSLLNLWFAANHKSEAYSISDKVQEVDERLSAIKPPNDITRCPRKVETDRQYWKASELRSFLLYYAPAVLLGILPDEHYKHFILLSEAIYILLGESITFAQIDHAEKLLQHFCLMFSALYQAGKETINIHSLLHLCDDVRNLGPLWTHSCFPFENYNGNLLKLFHGSQNVELQIVSAVAITQSLPVLSLKLSPGSVEEEFYKTLTDPLRVSKEQFVEGNIFALGSPQRETLRNEHFAALGCYLGYAPMSSEVHSFKRVRIGGSIFHSLSYKRVTSRNSYTVAFEDPTSRTIQVGQIDIYFQYQLPCTNTLSCAEQCVCPTRNLALVYVLQMMPNFHFVQDPLTHATALQMTAVQVPNYNSCRAKVIPISAIKDKLVFMHFNGQDVAFVSRFPNKVESD